MESWIRVFYVDCTENSLLSHFFFLFFLFFLLLESGWGKRHTGSCAQKAAKKEKKEKKNLPFCSDFSRAEVVSRRNELSRVTYLMGQNTNWMMATQEADSDEHSSFRDIFFI